MKILVFGNEFLENDSMAKKLADEVGSEKFVKCDRVEDILKYKDFVIMDVVEGIDKVMVIDDVDRLKASKLVSLHDFDLGFFLKLLKETGKLDKVKIIGIPMKGNLHEIKKQVMALL
ncbi:hypothetical protein KY316_03795 [Candidatus Woesearchaeota archaeon]|nr:hypothetical protein [Candidatus Woesearchaeota archaeon]